MQVALIGYRGTGKSTVGRLLAGRLGWICVDTDDEIERSAGMSIAEIFANQGEPAFRELESQVIGRLAAQDRLVLAVGGGAVLRAENRNALRRDGKVVWLQASIETLRQRIEADTTTAGRRPALTGQGVAEEIAELLAAREPLYRECADFVIDTESKTPATVAGEILARLGPLEEGRADR